LVVAGQEGQLAEPEGLVLSLKLQASQPLVELVAVILVVVKDFALFTDLHLADQVCSAVATVMEPIPPAQIVAAIIIISLQPPVAAAAAQVPLEQTLQVHLPPATAGPDIQLA
jgi:hypothetical protein